MKEQEQKFTLNAAGKTMIPLDVDEGRHRGLVRMKGAGLLTFYLHSPRPVRVWVGRHLVVDDLANREVRSIRIFRRLRVAVSAPLEAGEHPVVIEVGPRPHYNRWYDTQNFSSYREGIMKEIVRRIPDELEFSAAVVPGAEGPAVCVRFEPGQFRHEGSVWQDVWVRRIAGFAPLYQPCKEWGYALVSWTPTLSSSAAPGRSRPVAPWNERPSDEVRMYVPVTANGEEPPVARGVGKDDRPESERVVVGEVLLTVGDPSGEVVFKMPVFESVGKLAPKREYAKVAAPVFDEVWASVPEPVLPDEWEGFGRMYRASWEMLCKPWTAPDGAPTSHETQFSGLWRELPLESGYPNGYVRTAEQGFTHNQYVWDSCFCALAYAYGWRSFPVTASMDCLYSRQEDGGHIERCHDVRDGLPNLCEPGFGPNPPLFSAVELALANLSGNTDRLAVVLPLLTAHFGWLEANRRIPSGLYWTTGLANGRDNAPCQGDESLDMTAQMAHFARDLADIATLLGRDDEAADWLRKKDEIAAALNAILWSDALGCYAYSLVDGRPNPHKVATTFWPLWADVVPPERIEALARMARDPATFNRHHPFPTLAADSPQFRPKGAYWLGSVWAPTNYAALKGFWTVGEHALAREFACRHLQRMTEVFDATGGVFWENYTSEKSEPGSQSLKNYCWTCGNAISLLLETVIGLEPDAVRKRLRWTPPVGVRVGVKRYPLGEATLNLMQYSSENGDVIEVSSDRPLKLEICRNGERREFNVNKGVHRF